MYFTQVYDELIAFYNEPLIALVYGKIAGYARASGYCYASLGRIADELGMSWSTVFRRKEILVEDGFLIDTTKRRNRPNWFKVTDKLEKLSGDAEHLGNKSESVEVKMVAIEKEGIKTVKLDDSETITTSELDSIVEKIEQDYENELAEIADSNDRKLLVERLVNFAVANQD